MDRLWGGLAGMMIAAALLAMQLGGWIVAIVFAVLAMAIVGLLAFDEFHLDLGPVGILRVGSVWSIDFIPAKRGVYGDGLDPRRIKCRKIVG